MIRKRIRETLHLKEERNVGIGKGKRGAPTPPDLRRGEKEGELIEGLT